MIWKYARCGIARVSIATSFCMFFFGACLGSFGQGLPDEKSTVVDPFRTIDLPDAWEVRFWASPGTKALFDLDSKALSELVPVQAGIRYCRCPECDAGEEDDPLAWTPERPKELNCRRCRATFPNERFPIPEIKGDPPRDEKKKETEEVVEVLAGVFHHYPYREVDFERQRYAGERVYLLAKRDYETRAFLAKAAFYAAVRYKEQAPQAIDQSLARVAAVILLRFAQVYPAYATHYDQPLSPKYFLPANLTPPYQAGYRSAKWDWTGSDNIPLNLVIAHGLIRNTMALVEAGKLLNESDPARTIERNLFRASVDFVRNQPEDFGEASLRADIGILAVGRLLNDPMLMRDGLARLDRFAQQGFYYDGFWRQGTLIGHRRVLGQLDGWIVRLLSGWTEAGQSGGAGDKFVSPESRLPMLALAHNAASAVLVDPQTPEVQQAAWPAPSTRDAPRGPTLLGGTGLARLALGAGENALDIELRSLDIFGPDHIERQALRLAVGGRTVLGDLDESAPTANGFDRASVSHNTVVVDGLNQRESLSKAREPVAGGNLLFFAADPDFQVVTLDDTQAYQQSATRYRQTIVASAGAKTRYALAVFEVHGGLQHDAIWHGPSGSSARWSLASPDRAASGSLLPPGLTYLSTSKPGDHRWFVQSYGDFVPLSRQELSRPAQAFLRTETNLQTSRGVRLHMLGDLPIVAIAASSPDSTMNSRESAGENGRGSLILRRRSENGSTLRTTFVTLLEPISSAIPSLKRVGRVMPTREAIVIQVDGEDGVDHIMINLTPGLTVKLALGDGRSLSTDGLAVRVSSSGLVLAGGTFAECAGLVVRQEQAGGRIIGVHRRNEQQSNGWFETNNVLPDPESLAGRILVVRHGDGTTRSWTLKRVLNTPVGARLFVREEPGFKIDAGTGAANYYQFPRASYSGPHSYRVSRLSRSSPVIAE